MEYKREILKLARIYCGIPNWKLAHELMISEMTLYRWSMLADKRADVHFTLIMNAIEKLEHEKFYKFYRLVLKNARES